MLDFFMYDEYNCKYKRGVSFIVKNNHTFFENTECEYFPCHKADNEEFNCLFCYCPLYALGDKCGGNFTYTETGIKDCSNCIIPHSANGYEHIMSKLSEISETDKNK